MFERANTQRETQGYWQHTGHLAVSCLATDGTLESVILPGDLSGTVSRAEFDALVARVAALEARPVIDAVEDLKYGNG